MVGLVINKMSFEGSDGKTVEGVNLTLKGEDGFFIPRSKKDPSKLRFYSLPHNVYSSVAVGGIYNFTFAADEETGYSSITGCKATRF